MRGKIKKIAKSALCLLLVLCMAMPGSLRAKAEGKDLYVEDIKIHVASNDKDAKNYFDSIGYKWFQEDLNADTGTGKYVYIGYKTTTDPDKAITSIRLMQMSGGYQRYDYDGLVDYMEKQSVTSARALKKACDGFIENYEAGSPRAVDAYLGLNMFYVSEANNQLLGDFLIAGKGDEQFFIDLYVKGSSATVCAVTNLISIGLTAYENAYDEETETMVTVPWAGLVSRSTLWDRYEEGLTSEEEASLAREYEDLASSLFDSIQIFTTYYENARARFDNNGGKFRPSVEIKDIQEGADEYSEMTDQDGDITYLAAFEILNDFQLNEETKLGDWFLEIGHHTSETMDLKLLYPVLEAMGEAVANSVTITGFLSAVLNLDENVENKDFREAVAEFAEEGEKEGEPAVEVFTNLDDNFEGKSFAYTSEAIRKKTADNDPLSVLQQIDQTHAWINERLKVGGMIVGIGLCGVGLILAAAKIGVAITMPAAGSTAAVSTSYAFFSAAAGYLGTAVSVLGYISLAIVVVTLLVVLLVYIFKKKAKENKADFQSDKLDYIVDAVDYRGSAVNVLYKSALDQNGDVGDINAAKQWKWVLLCYSTDKGAGSPIKADEDGNFFKIGHDDPNTPDGYDAAKMFGDRNPADFNAFCEKGKPTYLFYTTEESLASRSDTVINEPDEEETTEPTEIETEETTEPVEEDTTKSSEEETTKSSEEETPVPEGNQPDDSDNKSGLYIRDVIIGIGATAQEARDDIVGHKDKYEVLNYNLSPDSSMFTYLGYQLTDDPEDAITDLRIAPYAGGADHRPVMYGDIQYTQIDVVGFDVGKGSKKDVPAANALYYTTDPNAGYPLTADGLHPVTGYDQIEPGWEPISYFGSDLPYNFNSEYRNQGTAYVNCFGHQGGYLLNGIQRVFLYYEPQKKYTSGVKYLSGMFFAGGYDILQQPKGYEYWPAETVSSNQGVVGFVDMLEYLPRSGRVTTENLAKSISNMYDNTSLRHGKVQQYLYYTWTYNPKRAVTDLALLQGDTFSTSLPYAVSKPTDGINHNYVSAVNIQQQFGDGNWIIRFESPNNTFMSRNANIISDTYLPDLINNCTTDVLPEGINFGYSRTRFLPMGLFVSGYSKDLTPLTLEDVIVSNGSNVKSVVEGTKVKYTLSGKTLAGTDIDQNKNYRPVPELKDPTRMVNMGYPKNSASSNATDLYLFVRGQQETKKKYIASLSVGAFSREIYKESNEKAKEDELKGIDQVVNNQAIVGAIAGCVDEVVVYNICAENQNDAWYNKQSGGAASQDAPENVPAAYIGLTRTDQASKAIKGVVLYKSKSSVAPVTITLDKVTYNCAGISEPIFMNGEKYYLYYTYNSGATPGVAIEEIFIDSIPIVEGAATNLCVNEGGSELYGNPKQYGFIHMTYDQKDRDFFKKIYIGKGANEREAMCDLLSMGCVEYANFDLNKGTKGSTVFLGYKSGSYNMDKIESAKTEEAREKEIAKQETEAIYDIVVTRNEPYHPEGIVSKGMYYYPATGTNLNDGCGYGSELYLYYATEYYSTNYNSKNNASTKLPTEVFSGFVTRLAFAQNERVPYTTLLLNDPDYQKQVTGAAGAGSTEDYYPWEYVMQSGDAQRIDLNDGALFCNGDYCEDSRISMFVQRDDGSIKPAGEITGGFVESTYTVGNLYIRK